jgi:hypothetical protein
MPDVRRRCAGREDLRRMSGVAGDMVKPRAPINTPAKCEAAREYIGASKAELARLLRFGLGGEDAIRRYETGARRIPGPYQVAMEALLSGWRPRGARLKP